MHAPQVFAPTQRAPSPARPVTRVSWLHPADSRAKVQYGGNFAAATGVHGFSEIIFMSSVPL